LTIDAKSQLGAGIGDPAANSGQIKAKFDRYR
jgi:hypothetical protein